MAWMANHKSSTFVSRKHSESRSSVIPAAQANQENHSISHFLKSRLTNNKISTGMIVESRLPNITRSSGEVRKDKLAAAISSPPPTAARVDRKIRKSLDD